MAELLDGACSSVLSNRSWAGRARATFIINNYNISHNFLPELCEVKAKMAA
jgi:hypothetical protein